MKLLSHLIVALILISGCGKNLEKCPEIFLLPVSISPQKPIYKVGDTLEVVSRFHYILPGYNENYATGERRKVGDYDMRGIAWRPVVHIFRVDSLYNDNPQYSVIDLDFTFLQQTANFRPFQYSESGTGLDGEYEYVNDNFHLSFKLVCHTSGTFFFRIGSSNSLRYAQPFDGWCKQLMYYTFYEMNENQNNNIDFLRESPHSHWNEWTIFDPQGRFRDRGGYCFKVEPR